MKVYEKIYEYYLDKMKEGSLKKGDKIPSLRETERILDVSRTSVETAYLQLAADGYIYSVEKVGFFASDMAERVNSGIKSSEAGKGEALPSRERETLSKYDLTTIAEDKQVSCLNLWRRYMKSALRQEDRLLSYSENQGEADLRAEIAAYVRKSRNIICSPREVVIGAGFQNLLQVLIPLISGEKTVSFPTREFSDGATTFLNAGFQVSYRDKSCNVIYVTPSYMTKWGDVMTMKRRHELIAHAQNNGHLIIEDDYQNELVFSSKPTPSLYAMTGGENVAFLGSFSRVLLPSVRISYLILPQKTAEEYGKIKDFYNQTASKAEQIALAQFLRDGHMNRHIKKMKRLYEEKKQIAIEALKENFTPDRVLVGESGMEIGLRYDDDTTKLLTFSRIPVEDIKDAVESFALTMKQSPRL